MKPSATVGVICLLITILLSPCATILEAYSAEPLVYEQAWASVVTVSTGKDREDMGTGFVVARGEFTVVLTANHVIDDAGGRILVRPLRCEFYTPVTLVPPTHKSRTVDFAVLLANRAALPECSVAPLREGLPVIGEELFMVGCPMGDNQGAYSFGRVNAPYPYKANLPAPLINEPFIPVNMSSTGGFSGAPVFDMEGRVVGMNLGSAINWDRALVRPIGVVVDG